MDTAIRNIQYALRLIVRNPGFSQTVLGKVFAGITALAGIGMIAMPTGILAASFSDGFSRARARADTRAEAVREDR